MTNAILALIALLSLMVNVGVTFDRSWLPHPQTCVQYSETDSGFSIIVDNEGKIPDNIIVNVRVSNNITRNPDELKYGWASDNVAGVGAKVPNLFIVDGGPDSKFVIFRLRSVYVGRVYQIPFTTLPGTVIMGIPIVTSEFTARDVVVSRKLQ